MAKSKGRLLAELLASDGKVKESKSALDIAGGKLAPDDIPILPNSKLENSSISIAGHSTSLGESVSLNTGDITEHTNYKYYTEGRVRSAISATGDIVYNSTTGVISFSQAAGAVVSVNGTTGSVVLDTGDIAENGNLYHTTARARAAISATGSLSYNSTTGVISFTMPAQNTSNITEGSNKYYTDARVGSYLSTNGYATQSTIVGAITDSAPATLDTLNELAAALGDDANFSTTVTNSIGTKWTQNNTKIGQWDTAYGWGNHASAGYVTSSGNTVIGTDTDLSFSGANVLSTIALTDGVITSYTNRVLTLANLGYTGETNATADQSAAEILTAIKTVDGSGSGLDADLLDGQQGSYYATASALTTTTATTNAALPRTGGAMTGTITGRDFKTQAGYHFQRSDHHSGHLEGSYNNVGANGPKSNPIYTIGSSYNPASTTLGNMYGIGYSRGDASFLTSLTGSVQWGMYVAGDGDARIWLGGTDGIIKTTGQHYVGANVVWNAGNDGAGSGLDADLLDGQHGSYYLAYGNLTGSPTIPTIPSNNVVEGGTSYSGEYPMVARTSATVSYTHLTLPTNREV